MDLYLFVLILCLFDSISSPQNKKEISKYIFPNEIENLSFPYKININENLIYLTANDNIKGIIKGIIESIAGANESELDKFISGVHRNRDIIINMSKEIFNKDTSKFMVDIIEDILLNESNTLLNDTIHIIANKSNNISANLIELLKVDELNSLYALRYFKSIFKVDEFFDFYKRAYLRYRNYIMNVSELIVGQLNNANLTILFNSLKDFIDNHLDDFYIFVYDMVKFYGQRTTIIEKVRDFIIFYADGNYTLFQDMKQIIDDKNKTKIILDAFFGLNRFTIVGKHLIYEFLFDTNLMNFVFYMINNSTFVDSIANMTLVLYTPNFYSSVKKILNDIVVNNKTNLDLFLNISVTIGKNFVKREDVDKFVKKSAINTITQYIFNFTNKYSISKDCKNLLLNTYTKDNIVDDDGEDKFPMLFFLKKLILESSLNKNDFLS